MVKIINLLLVIRLQVVTKAIANIGITTITFIIIEGCIMVHFEINGMVIQQGSNYQFIIAYLVLVIIL